MSEKITYDKTSLVHRNDPKFLASPLGEEVVMMNTDNGDYLGVNNVGTEIWNIIEEPISIADLTQRLLAIYDVTEDQLNADLDPFLKQMINHDMIIVNTPE